MISVAQSQGITIPYAFSYESKEKVRAMIAAMLFVR